MFNTVFKTKTQEQGANSIEIEKEGLIQKSSFGYDKEVFLLEPFKGFNSSEKNGESTPQNKKKNFGGGDFPWIQGRVMTSNG